MSRDILLPLGAIALLAFAAAIGKAYLYDHSPGEISSIEGVIEEAGMEPSSSRLRLKLNDGRVLFVVMPWQPVSVITKRPSRLRFQDGNFLGCEDPVVVADLQPLPEGGYRARANLGTLLPGESKTVEVQIPLRQKPGVIGTRNYAGPSHGSPSRDDDKPTAADWLKTVPRKP